MSLSKECFEKLTSKSQINEKVNQLRQLTKKDTENEKLEVKSNIMKLIEDAHKPNENKLS